MAPSSDRIPCSCGDGPGKQALLANPFPRKHGASSLPAVGYKPAVGCYSTCASVEAWLLRQQTTSNRILVASRRDRRIAHHVRRVFVAGPARGSA